MFNFTTTTFIHSADQIKAATDLGGNATGVVKIDNKLIRLKDIVAAYKKESVEASTGKLKVKPLTDAGKQYRLKFYIQRSGDANSLYANDFVFKGKEFVYEWKSDKVANATDLTKLIKKINKLYGDVYLKVNVDGDYCVIESDNYGSFVEACIEEYSPNECSECGYNGHWEFVEGLDIDTEFDDPTADIKVKKSGDENLQSEFAVNGTGTYEQLIKDLRLPTMENLNWTSLTKMQNELPIPGHTYTQYTIHMVAPRTGLAHQAIEGLQQSKTTHVFFVDECADADGNTIDLESALTGVTVKTAELPLNAPQRADFESLHHDAIKDDDAVVNR